MRLNAMKVIPLVPGHSLSGYMPIHRTPERRCIMIARMAGSYGSRGAERMPLHDQGRGEAEDPASLTLLRGILLLLVLVAATWLRWESFQGTDVEIPIRADA